MMKTARRRCWRRCVICRQHQLNTTWPSAHAHTRVEISHVTNDKLTKVHVLITSWLTPSLCHLCKVCEQQRIIQDYIKCKWRSMVQTATFLKRSWRAILQNWIQVHDYRFSANLMVLDIIKAFTVRQSTVPLHPPRLTDPECHQSLAPQRICAFVVCPAQDYSWLCPSLVITLVSACYLIRSAVRYYLDQVLFINIASACIDHQLRYCHFSTRQGQTLTTVVVVTVLMQITRTVLRK